jgi:hypothetical protein
MATPPQNAGDRPVKATPPKAGVKRGLYTGEVNGLQNYLIRSPQQQNSQVASTTTAAGGGQARSPAVKRSREGSTDGNGKGGTLGEQQTGTSLVHGIAVENRKVQDEEPAAKTARMTKTVRCAFASDKGSHKGHHLVFCCHQICAECNSKGRTVSCGCDNVEDMESPAVLQMAHDCAAAGAAMAASQPMPAVGGASASRAAAGTPAAAEGTLLRLAQAGLKASIGASQQTPGTALSVSETNKAKTAQLAKQLLQALAVAGADGSDLDIGTADQGELMRVFSSLLPGVRSPAPVATSSRPAENGANSRAVLLSEQHASVEAAKARAAGHRQIKLQAGRGGQGKQRKRNFGRGGGKGYGNKAGQADQGGRAAAK